MTAKQILNSSSAPDGSLYVTLTDGAGNLTTTGNVTIGTTPISGGATTQVLFNLGGVVSSDSGFTYAGSSGAVIAGGLLRTSSAGAAATPSLSVGNTTTGLYSVSTTGFGISTNGVTSADFGITNVSAWTLGNNSSLYLIGGANLQIPNNQKYTWSNGTGLQSTGSGVYVFQNNGNSQNFTISTSATAGLAAFSGGVSSTSISTSTTVNDTGYDYQTPSTGGTVTLSNSKCHMIIDPAGTLATLTVNMPATPTDGMIVDVRFSQIVTTLTVSGNGNSIKGNPSSAAVGSQFTAIYRLANTTWYI